MVRLASRDRDRERESAKIGYKRLKRVARMFPRILKVEKVSRICE